jgi:hypothetical protein
VTVRDVQYQDGATSAYHIGLGDNGQSAAARSAYIDNLHYAAIEATAVGATSVDSGDGLYANANSTAYLVSGDQLNVTSFFPDTFPETKPGSGNRPFCDNCEFLKWGAWGARVNFGNPTASDPKATRYADNLHLGWWVAGDLSSNADIDALAATGASATYTGHVIGNVASNLDNTSWKTYVAAGKLAMYWNFACRNGDLTISNFDGRTFGTGPHNLTQPNLTLNQFRGPLTSADLTGGVTGSFANNGAVKAGGVLGNWNVSNATTGVPATYKATGIFGGSGVPSIPVHGN